MPPQERDRRLADQRQRLAGVQIRHASEPSHALVDKFVKMLHDACLSYVPLSSCTSREDEMACMRTEKQLLTMERNQLVLKVKEPSGRVDLGSELRVLQSLTYLALAADQAGLISFKILDAIHQSFLVHLSRPAPPGFDPPAIASLLRADQELWKLVSDEGGSKVQQDDSGRNFDRLYSSPTVVFYMLPTPKQSADGKKRRKSVDSESASPQRKKAKKSTQKSSGRMPKALVGLSSKDKHGVPYCYNFNCMVAQRRRTATHLAVPKGCTCA